MRIVNGIDQHFRLFGPGRLQQIDPGGIAVENFHIKFAQGYRHGPDHDRGSPSSPAREQQSPGNLPEAAKAGDNHPRLLFINLASITRLAAGRFLQTGSSTSRMGLLPSTGHRQGQPLGPFAVQYIRHPRGAKHHKRELTPCPSSTANQRRCARGTPSGLAISHSISILSPETDQQNHNTQRMGDQGAEINRLHADADKEQPQQQSFKRLNITLQRMTIFGLASSTPARNAPIAIDSPPLPAISQSRRPGTGPRR